MLTVAWVSPFPPDHRGGGGQIRQAYLLDGLAAHASIHLICPGPVTDPAVRAAVASVVSVPVAPGWRDNHRWWRRAADVAAAVWSRSPIEVRAFAPARRAFRPALAGVTADLVLVEFAGLAPLLRRRRSVARAPWVLTFHNLPSRMAAQQAEIMPRRRQRWLLRRDARTARAFERRAASAFDAVITCTAADAATVPGRVLVVANGTDVDRFQPSPVPSAPRLVFTGALYTNPNTDAAAWMCQAILPLIRAVEPATHLDIVGARPTPEVLALGRLPGVTVHADVADVADFLRAARVAVVPIRVGSGSRLKALEALAAGRPVVGTTIGLEGLDLLAGEDVLVADDPAAFAAEVVRLLRDDSLAEALAHAGRAAVVERFAWPGIAAGFTSSLLAVATEARSSGRYAVGGPATSATEGSPMSMTLDTEEWGLPKSTAVNWVRGLDWLRRHAGHRIVVGRQAAAAISRRLPPTLDTELWPGIHLRIDLRQPVARDTWWSGRHYEAPTPAILCGWLEKADCFFDIGANYGWYSYLALSCSNADVYAFEPNPTLVHQMNAARSFNNLGRFHPQHLGLSDESGELGLHGTQTNTGFSTFGAHPTLLDDGLAVPVVSFDKWREDSGLALPTRPSWVAKIDVEGFETRVLQGMAECLRAHAFAGLAVELNEFTLNFCGTSVSEVIQTLDDSGYRMEHRTGEERSLNRFFRPAAASESGRRAAY